MSVLTLAAALASAPVLSTGTATAWPLQHVDGRSSAFLDVAADGAGAALSVGRESGLAGANGSGGLLVRLAADGRPTHELSAWRLDGSFRAVARSPAGGWLALGDSSAAPDGTLSPVLFRLDESLASSWQWARTSGNEDGPTALLALADGGALVAVRSGPVPAGEAWLARVDGAGTLTWELALATGRGSELTGLAVHPAGGFLALGRLDDGGRSRPWLLRLDDAGAISWQRWLSLPTGTLERGLDLAATPDGLGFALSARGGGTLLVARIALDGAPVWSATLDLASERGVVLPMADGSTLLVAEHARLSDPADLGQLLLRFDGSGALQSQTFTTGGGTETLGAATELAGGVLAVGREPWGSVGSAGMARLLGVDSPIGESCLQQPATNVTATGAVLSTSDANAMPQPATSMAWLASFELRPLPAWHLAAGTSDWSWDGDCSSASVVRPGLPLTRNACGSAMNWFSLPVVADVEYTVSTGALGAAADTVLELMGDDCVSVLASDDDGGPEPRASLLRFTAAATGAQRVRVRQADGLQGPDRGYELRVAGDPTTAATWLVRLLSNADFRSLAVAWSGQTALLSGVGEGPFALSASGAVSLAAMDYAVIALRPSASGALLASGWDFSGAGRITQLEGCGAGGWAVSLTGSDGPVSATTSLPTPDGDIAVVGAYGFGIGGFTMKLSATGELLWQSAFATTDPINAPSRGLVLADGSVLMVGEPFRRVSATGEVLWTKRMSSPGLNLTANGAVATSDGGFIAVGSINSWSADDARAWAARLDSEGVVSWSVAFPDTHPTSFINAISSGADGLVACGRGDLGTEGGEDGLVVELASDGTLGRQLSYDLGPGPAVFHDLQPVPGGGFLLAGSGIVLEAEPVTYYDGFALRVDENWAIGGGCTRVRDGLLALEPIPFALNDVAEMPASPLTVTPIAFTAPAESPVTTAAPCIEAGAPNPPEVSAPGSGCPLLFEDHETLTWEPATQTGVADFMLYRGLIAELNGGPAAHCHAGPLATNRLSSETDRPGPGNAWFYLVTGRVGGVEGRLGQASDGRERMSATPCP